MSTETSKRINSCVSTKPSSEAAAPRDEDARTSASTDGEIALSLATP
jgi:hypothetical protein